MPNTSTPSVLIISEPPHAAQLASGLAELAMTPSRSDDGSSAGAEAIEVSVSGGEAAIAMVQARRPDVVVIDASMRGTDAKAMLATLRAMVQHATVAFVLVGDEHGAVRTSMDAIECAPDRFVPRPLVPGALRVAVQEVLADVLGKRRPIQAATTADASAQEEPLGEIFGLPEGSAVESDSAIEHPGPLPSPPLFEIRPRKDHQPIAEIQAWGDEPPPSRVRTRESTLTIRAPDPDPPAGQAEQQGSRMRSPSHPPPIPAIRSRGITGSPIRNGAPQPTAAVEDDWSEPTPLSEVVERHESAAVSDKLPSVDTLDALDADAMVISASPMYDVGEFDDPDLIVPTPVPQRVALDEAGPGQDFARQLRAKMSLMAQRLFKGEPGADGEPRNNGHRDPVRVALGIDSPGSAAARLPPGDRPGMDRSLDRGVTAIARVNFEPRGHTPVASPSSWSFQVGEQGFFDSGELVRGSCDAAVVLAKVFARRTTGRVSFRHDEIEKIVFVDSGRPVFASSNAPGDRMGELLVREGKITAAQYDRCQADVARSGRRIGEILVDFGYLKRRELLPAVRRHVEDIVFSLFGWTSGRYQVTPDAAASGERIRMSRHPAALVLEGIRRKLDRSTLEQLLGPPSTVIDVTSRDRLGAIVHASDLMEEERAALAAFDGRADLSTVARSAGVDIADVLPLAWGLCVLELATARRVEPEDSSSGALGETDLAIDRERIRTRWNLVEEADYFALLGVRRDATGFEIRRAYQAVRRDFSAENFPVELQRELSRELADIAAVLDEAFRVMRDDRLREAYLSHLP